MTRWQREWVRLIKDLAKQLREKGHAEAIWCPRVPLKYISLNLTVGDDKDKPK